MNLNDQFLRLAIYEIYNGRCFYTGNPLEYSNMELDHIIPRRYKDQPIELERIINEYNLDKDFQVDSLLNLVPTTKYNNRRKGDKEFNPKDVLFFISFTREKAPLIQKKMMDLKKTRNYEKHLSLLKTQVDEVKDEKLREKLLLDILSFISDESDEFEKQEQIYYKEKIHLYRKYMNNIRLEAIMPSYNNPQTECVIYFKTLYARDCMVIIDNKTVLSQLFKGLYTDPKYGTRGFLICPKLKNEVNDSIDLKNTKIDLGNTRLKLSIDDIYQLCNVIDGYATQYIEYIKRIENVLKTHSFPVSRRINNYKLLYVTYAEWRKLIDFAYKNDVDNGNSKWNIFDRNKHYIKIFTKKHANYEEGYHAFFHVEHSEDFVMYQSLSPNDVCITFEFIEDLDNIGNIHLINERSHWNAEIAYKWLVNELLPKVLGKRQSYKHAKTDLLGINLVDNIVYINRIEILNYKDLKEVVELIQLHFHCNPHNKYRVRKLDLQGIYNSILLCINKSKVIDLFYLCNKLYLSECRTKNELIESITEINYAIEDTTLNGFGIDLLYRALLVALDSCEKYLTLKDIKFITSNLDFFVTLRDREILLGKYAVEFH